MKFTLIKRDGKIYLQYREFQEPQDYSTQRRDTQIIVRGNLETEVTEFCVPGGITEYFVGDQLLSEFLIERIEE